MSFLKRYAIDGEQNAAATTSILSLTTSSTAMRPTVYFVTFGSAATPADNAFGMLLARHTADGTGTAVTPQPLTMGSGDIPAATATAKENHTVEPTYTAGANLLRFSVNQQATFSWSAPEELGLILPQTAASGIGLYFNTVSGGTALCESTWHFSE